MDEEVFPVEPLKPVRPWDLINASESRVPADVRDERMQACLRCEFLFIPTRTCKKCGCFMTAKTKLARAYCPEGKWGSYETSTEQ